MANRDIPRADGSFTGTGARAWNNLIEKVGESVSVKDFGALCDGTTDDTAAFQAAVDSFGSTAVFQRSGTLRIPGPTVISSTITIERKSIVLQGSGGWGNTQDSSSTASYIKWNGSAGIPMIKIINAQGFGMRDIRLVGKSTAKPSAAINFNQGAGLGMENNWLENVHIGTISGDSSDDADQFTHGLLLDGNASNNAEFIFTNLYINKVASDGVHIGYSQMINHTFNDLVVVGAANGIFCCGNASGFNWRFDTCDVDINQPFSDDAAANCNSYCNVIGYHSEGAGRMAVLKGGSLHVIGGSFQVTSSLNSDGKVISSGGGGNTCLANLVLRDILWTQTTSPSTAPFLDFAGTAGVTGSKSIILDGMEGWSTVMVGGTNSNGLNANVTVQTDTRYIYFREKVASTAGTVPRQAQQFLRGTNVEWNIQHYDVRNDFAVKWHDDFLGDVLADQWGSAVGTDPQVVAPAVVAGEHGGMMRMTTGDDAAADMATNGVQLHSFLNWIPNRGGLYIEGRIRIPTGVTSLVVYFGFSDQVSALEMPFTLGAGDVLTANASNAVGILYDTAADTDNWWLVGVANNVAATKQNTGAPPPAGTYQTWRIEVTDTGAAIFFLNGVQVGTAMTAATTATVALTPYYAAFRRGAASRDIECDYIHVEANRFT